MTLTSGTEAILNDVRKYFGFETAITFDYYALQYIVLIDNERFTLNEPRLPMYETLDFIATWFGLICTQIELSKSERAGYW